MQHPIEGGQGEVGAKENPLAIASLCTMRDENLGNIFIVFFKLNVTLCISYILI